MEDTPKIVELTTPRVTVEICPSLSGTKSIVLDGKFVLAEVHYEYPYIDNAGQRAVVDAILSALGVDAARANKEASDV